MAQRPTPVEPIGAIFDAFTLHSLVAMSDAHGNEQNHAFRIALIRDPRFSIVVNDIVLELGNALYQDLADRYIRGEDVPYADLRRIWENTVVQTGGNNYLMIEELLQVVRDVNGRLPKDRGIRVLLGDPPIDWDRVHGLEPEPGTRTGNQNWELEPGTRNPEPGTEPCSHARMS